MKKKQLSNQRQSQSPKHKVSQSEPSDQLVHSFINLLTEKVNEMHGMINKIDVNTSSNSNPLSISSILPEATLLNSESLTSSPLSNDFLSEEFDLNDIRLQINTENSEIGDDGSRLGAAGSTIQIIAHRIVDKVQQQFFIGPPIIMPQHSQQTIVTSLLIMNFLHL